MAISVTTSLLALMMLATQLGTLCYSPAVANSRKPSAPKKKPAGTIFTGGTHLKPDTTARSFAEGIDAALAKQYDLDIEQITAEAAQDGKLLPKWCACYDPDAWDGDYPNTPFGQRNNYMEDRIVMAPCVYVGKVPLSLAAVFDGHGGEGASAFLAGRWQTEFLSQVEAEGATDEAKLMGNSKEFEATVSNILNKMVLKLSEDFSTLAQGNSTSGSMINCWVVNLVTGQAVNGNLGDCRFTGHPSHLKAALLQPSFTSRDHSVSNWPTETPAPEGTYFDKSNPNKGKMVHTTTRAQYAFTHTFGDLNMAISPCIGRQMAFEDVSGCKAFIMATDGLWDVIDVALAYTPYLEMLKAMPKHLNVTELINYVKARAKSNPAWDNTSILCCVVLPLK